MPNIVQFRKQAVQDNFQTATQKRPVFIEKDYIKILIPNDRNLIIDRPVRDEDKIEYAHEWQQYQFNCQKSQTGTPLEEWTQISVSQIKTLKYHNVSTVEQLAALSDAGIQGLGMGYTSLRDSAVKFLAASSELKQKEELQQKLDELNEKYESLLNKQKEVSSSSKKSTKTAIAEKNDGLLEKIAETDKAIDQLSEDAQ